MQTSETEKMAELWNERLRYELAHPPFHAVFKPEAVGVDPSSGAIRIRVPYQEHFSASGEKPFVHGGVVATLIDISAHAAVAVQTGRTSPTIDLRIDFLRPVPAADIYATARPLKIGRTVARVDVEITNAEGTVFAAGRGTFSTSAN